MIAIKEKIQSTSKNGDAIACNNIKIYAQIQKPKQFDGLLYALIKAFENMKISFQIVILDSCDAFGCQLPLLRLENKIIQRQSFLEVIRILYLHSDHDTQGEEKNSRVSNLIDLCSKLDYITTFFQFYDEETEYKYRDAYSWFVHPIKKYTYRWRMRVFSHYFEQKGLLNKSNILNDVILILTKLIEIFELSGSKTFSQGIYGGKQPLELDLCDILVTGVLLQSHFNLSEKCDLVKLLEQGRFSKLREFCTSFFQNNNLKLKELNNAISNEGKDISLILTKTGVFNPCYEDSVPLTNLSLFYESTLHPEVQQAREKVNEKAPTSKKLRKRMINNLTINGFSLLVMGVILYKFQPKVVELTE